ncbi:MAG: hypothetical protein KGL39_05625 [Patescibacteria group bacterium]|nr:hypothetical protein [Patescibacteria group bacterium]
MSGDNSVPCQRCNGCGKLANTDAQEPWTYWLALPLRSAAAVILGIVKPVPCHACGGSGTVPSEVSGR